MSSENKRICEIIAGYSPNMMYRDVYDQMLEHSRKVGVWNSDIGLLDKWLWKYREYIVEKLVNTLESSLGQN